MNGFGRRSFRRVSGSGYVGVQIIFAEILNSFLAGALLSQFCYWSQNESDEDGWFQKTQSQIEDYMFLSRRDQESAKKKMADFGFFETKLVGLPSRMFYRLNWDAIEFAVDNFERKSQKAKISSIEKSNTNGKDCPETLDSISMAQNAMLGRLQTPSADGVSRHPTNIKSIENTLSHTREEFHRNVDNFLPTQQGLVCVEWVKLGIRCNPSNPNLLEALKAGVTPEELIETAKEIVGNVQNPSINYIIKAVIGRRNDAAKLAQSLKDNPLPNKVLDFKKAYEEAVEQSRIRFDGGKDEWSSPAIFHAARRLGGDLQRFSWHEIKTRWAEALDWALTGLKDGSLGVDIPPFVKACQNAPKRQETVLMNDSEALTTEERRKKIEEARKKFPNLVKK